MAQAREGPLVPPHAAARAVAARDAGASATRRTSCPTGSATTTTSRCLPRGCASTPTPTPSSSRRWTRRRAELQAGAIRLGERLYAEKPSAYVRRLRRLWDGLARHLLGRPNTMPGVRGANQSAAGPSSRSGRRGRGTSSTRAGRSRSCTRCWCCSRPRRSGWRRTGRCGLALAGARARRARAVALLVRAARPRAAVARRAGGAAAAGAVARAGAARGRARRLRVLHGRRLGVGLLPPAHRRAVDERPALLAARAHELRPHERQRARAAAEAADRAERGRRCWRRSRARGSLARVAAALAIAGGAGRARARARSRDAPAALPGAARRASPRRRRSPGAST